MLPLTDALWVLAKEVFTRPLTRRVAERGTKDCQGQDVCYQHSIKSAHKHKFRRLPTLVMSIVFLFFFFFLLCEIIVRLEAECVWVLFIEENLSTEEDIARLLKK